MLKTCLKIILFFIPLIVFSQKQFIRIDQNKQSNQTQIKKNIKKQGLSYYQIEYSIPGFTVASLKLNNNTYQLISIKGMGRNSTIGKPALPIEEDVFAIPDNTTPVVTIIDSAYQFFEEYLVAPVQNPPRDTYGAENPAFVIDQETYQSSSYYPSKPVSIKEIQEMRGIRLAVIQVAPVLFYPEEKKIKIYSKIHYKINFIGEGSVKRWREENSHHFLQKIRNSILNPEIIPSMQEE